MWGSLIRLVLLASLALLAPCAAVAVEPMKGTPERAAVVDAVRARTEKDLGSPLMFQIQHINIDAGWAYVEGTPSRGDGKPFPWATTRFAKAFAEGVMSDEVMALMRLSGANWQLVEYALGPSDVAWEEWVVKHGLNRGFFESGGPALAAAAPTPNPTAPPAKPVAAATAAGWRAWRLKHMAREAPARWAIAPPNYADLDFSGGEWALAFVENPADIKSGAMFMIGWGQKQAEIANSVSKSANRKLPAIVLGVAATRLEFQATDNVVGYLGFTLITNAPFAGRPFSLTCFSPATQWKATRADCERALASVKFIADEPSPPVASAPAPGPTPPGPAVLTGAPASKPPSGPSAAEVASASSDAGFKNYVAALAQLEAFEKTRNYEFWYAGLADAERATQFAPRQADYWRALGYAYALIANDDLLAGTLAESALNKAIRLDAGNASARLTLGQLLLDRRSYSLALDHFESALRVRPADAESLLIATMCRAYLVDGQGERGIKFLTGFVAANPKAQPARLGLAILLQELGRVKDALPLVQVVVADPRTAQADAEQARQLEKAWKEGVK